MLREVCALRDRQALAEWQWSCDPDSFAATGCAKHFQFVARSHGLRKTTRAGLDP